MNTCLLTNQRKTSPVGGNAEEHAMFNFAPFTGVLRQVTNLDGQLLFVG